MIRNLVNVKRVTAAGAVALLLAWGAPAMAHAQSFGVKMGVSYGTVSNSGVFPGDVENRTGFAAGIALRTSGAIGIGVEGLYAQRGVSVRELDYIDIPAYLRIGIPSPAFSPFIYAGPQISFEIDCNDDGTECPDADDEDRPKTTYAGIIGAGIKLGNLFTVEARYVYGLTNLHLDTVTESENYKTRSFLVLAGISFQ